MVVTDAAVKQALREKAGVPATIEQAPVSIVLALRMGWNHNKLSIVQSLGMAAQNLLLAATSLRCRAPRIETEGICNHLQHKGLEPFAENAALEIAP